MIDGIGAWTRTDAAGACCLVSAFDLDPPSHWETVWRQEVKALRAYWRRLSLPDASPVPIFRAGSVFPEIGIKKLPVR